MDRNITAPEGRASRTKRVDPAGRRLLGLLLSLALLVPGLVTVLVARPAGALSETDRIVAWAGTGQSGTPVAGPALSSPLVGGYLHTDLDADGNLYVADHNRILRIDPSGRLTVVAGNGVTGAAVPGPALQSPLFAADLAVDGDGNVYVTDFDSLRVVKVTPDGQLSVFAGNGQLGTPVAGPATDSPLDGPRGIVAAADGSVYVTDVSTDMADQSTRILRIVNGALTVIAGKDNRDAATE